MKAWLEEEKKRGDDMTGSTYIKKIYVKSDWDPPYARADIENELNDKLEGKRVRLDWNYNVKTNDQIVYSIMIVDDQP